MVARSPERPTIPPPHAWPRPPGHLSHYRRQRQIWDSSRARSLATIQIALETGAERIRLALDQVKLRREKP